MATAKNFDTRELRNLEFDLREAPRRMRNPEGLHHASRVIEREMRVDAAGHKGNWFGKPGTDYVIPTPPVSHDLLSPTSAEIGIENRDSGSLFHLIAYGGPRNGPAYDPGAGPRRAMNQVAGVMADQAEESVLGKGGGH